jgi:tetratricopeptide (TPR) repeat protein
MTQLDPDNLEARQDAIRRAVAAGASGDAIASELRALAEAFRERGEEARALEVLGDLLRYAPGDREAAAELARTHAAEGRHDEALACLDALGEIDDVDLLLLAGTLRSQHGRLDAARAAFARLLAREPHRCDAMVLRAGELGATDPDAALAHLEPAADVLILRGDYEAAVSAYEQFLGHQPHHLGALQRVVALCLEGGLEPRLAAAQVQLVDAYLAASRPVEARAVAERLVASHPDVPEYVERLREALRRTGEPNPETVIADGLNATSPEIRVGPGAAEPGASPEVAIGHAEPGDEPGASGQSSSDGADPFRLGPAAIDLRDILGDALEGHADADAGEAGDAGEIDLSAALERLANDPPKPTAAPEPDLEEVFGEFREEVTRDSNDQDATQHYRLALAYRDMGMVPEATRELEVAARSPRLRFEAAALLGRLCNQRGERHRAIEWLERAAEAPAPSVEEGRSLLYELADTLEGVGEGARALAVLLELRADAGEYRDVTRRIDRLSRLASGG